MNRYYVTVRWSDSPGSGVGRVLIMAENQYQAIQLAKAQYGRLLVSESAMIAYD